MDNQQIINNSGELPLNETHICFDKGHAMYERFTFHNHQSSWGQHKCSRCGYKILHRIARIPKFVVTNGDIPATTKTLI